MKEEKRHVGRPTNEEVRERKINKFSKVAFTFIIVIALVLGVKNTNFNSLKGATNSRSCNMTLTPGANQINGKIICGVNARPSALYLKNKNGSMRGKKFFTSSKFGGVTTFSLKQLELGKTTLTLKYDSKVNKTVKRVVINNTTNITSGNDISFYNLGKDDICEAIPVQLENKKLKYNIKCGKNAKLYNVVIWDNKINASREINYKAKTDYSYGETSTVICDSKCYNIDVNNSYHIRLYWSTKDITTKTGLNLYVRSTGNFDYRTFNTNSYGSNITPTTVKTTSKYKKTTTSKKK